MSDFKATMHQNRFQSWGSAPDPDGGAYSAPPDLLAVFKGLTSKGKRGGREGKGKGRGRERGEEGEGRDGRGRTTLHTPCRKFLATPLISICISIIKNSYWY